MVDFKWVLLFQLYFLIQNANSRQSQKKHKPVESQSEQNESEMEETTHRHHHRRKYRHPEDDYEIERQSYKDNQVYPHNYEDECNNCACNKCDNPPDCCKAVCDSCFQSRQSQFSMMSMQDMTIPTIQMPQMPMPMPMPGMPMPGMPMPGMPIPGMPMMGMPVPGIPVPGVPMSLMQISPPSPFGSPGVVYVGVPPNLFNFLDSTPGSPTTDSNTAAANTSTIKNEPLNLTAAPIAPAAPIALAAPVVPAAPVTPTTSTAPAVPTAPAAPITPAATIAPATPIVPAVPIAPVAPTNTNSTYQRIMMRGSNLRRPSIPCQSDGENNKRIALVLENAIDAFTKIIKAPDTGLPRRNRNENYMLASPLRRTKSLGSNPPKYGVVQIPSNVAQRLLFQMRNAKDIRRTL